MACEHPTRAYLASTGQVRIFKHTDKQYHIEPYTGLLLSCGYCILCRADQARQWAVRIYNEAQCWDISSFVTLTYSDKHLPTHSSLNYPDLQKFWKRLRKKYGKLSYYSVGEYGDKTLRPHYHACIFGHAFTENRTIIRRDPSLLWTSPELERAWGLGNVSVGALNYQTAEYTASYVTKKLARKQQYVRLDEETGELIRLAQPRALPSKRPAIGLRWLERFGHQVYHHDQVIVDGRPMRPPRYYDRWLKSQDQETYLRIKEQRLKKATPLTREQTRARARSAHARAKSKSKSV